MFLEHYFTQMDSLQICFLFRDEYMKEKSITYSINQGFDDQDVQVKIPDIIKGDNLGTKNEKVYTEKDGLPAMQFLNNKGETTKF